VDPAVTVDEPTPGVRRLRIGNESRRGALSTDVLKALEAGVTDAPADTRCLVLAGSGNTFSAGYDLRAVSSPPDPEHADATIAPERVAILELLDRQPLPIVGAINGPAFGGGLELLLACDIRIAVPSASLAAPAGRVGLVYSPSGFERILAELPHAVASDLFLAGGELSAERAQALGVINQVVWPDQLERAAVAVAQRIAELSPVSVQGHRAALRALRSSARTLPTEDRTRLLQVREQALRGADFAEGVAAFRERRPPRFN
jgi:enoyl-CoA hydratase/carnithine racemase